MTDGQRSKILHPVRPARRNQLSGFFADGPIRYMFSGRRLVGEKDVLGRSVAGSAQQNTSASHGDPGRTFDSRASPNLPRRPTEEKEMKTWGPIGTLPPADGDFSRGLHEYLVNWAQCCNMLRPLCVVVLLKPRPPVVSKTGYMYALRIPAHNVLRPEGCCNSAQDERKKGTER